MCDFYICLVKNVSSEIGYLKEAGVLFGGFLIPFRYAVVIGRTGQ